MKDTNENRWNELLSHSLIGKLVLVGIVNLNAEGKLLNQQQFFGRVSQANQINGILLQLEGNQLGKEYNLPPDTAVFHPASPGQYRLYSTGEIVFNPDFTVSFTIQKPAETKSAQNSSAKN